MKKNRRIYRVMIVPERNGHRTYSFQISNIWVSIFFAGIIAIMAISVFLMYKSVQVARKLHYYHALQNDNERLIKENNQLQAVRQKFTHLDSIATYIEQLSTVIRPPVKGVVGAGTSNGLQKSTVAGEKADSLETSAPSILPVDGWITQQFTKDTTQDGGAHPGIDIAAPAGMIIKAPAPGIVTAVLQDVDYGTMVVLQHNDGIVTRYGHCEKAMVSVNDKIIRGQPIAVVGNTGHSSAPHLHYEVILNGKNVDPQHYITPSIKTVK